MSFSKFAHLLKWKTSVHSNRMKTILRNQFAVYFWSTKFMQSYKTYNFYIKMFREQNFFNFIKKIKSNVKINRNTFYSLMAGPLYFTIEDWENNRIYLDDDAKRYLREFDFIEQLKNPKNVIENFSKECCLTGNNNCDDINLWEFYVQKDNMITWRREEEDNPGQYAYKVYVKYDDITAEDFLHVQMDIDYRREWDDTAVSLEVIDSDPFDNQQVIYWEMQWPKLFANRDYVFLRKCFIDRKRNLILICCKSINHPRYPENPRLERVKDYWSYMVIKPSTTFNQKGFEFSLTYYDNPGIKIPKYVTNYVSQRQLPEFIKQLYHATIKYAEKRAKESWKETKDPGFEYPSDTRLDDYENDTEEEHMPDNVNFNKQSVSSNEKEVISTVEEDTSHRKSWWSYLIPFYYHT